jgi:hypothetical protein
MNRDLRVGRRRCKSENDRSHRDEELFHGAAARKRIATVGFVAGPLHHG